MSAPRYALYDLPEDDGLAEWGAAWLGWDARLGTERPHPDLPGLPVPIGRLTERPRKYGFHATLKPPFHLAKGQSEGALLDSAATIARTLAPVRIDGLTLSDRHGFLALRPDGAHAGSADLAARLVADLDAFRAPPGPVELARRHAARLTPTQRANLRDWGYPYVMGEFGYHITLTGPLGPNQAEAAMQTVKAALAPVLPHPYWIRSIGLLRSDEHGRFHLLRRLPLGAF